MIRSLLDHTDHELVVDVIDADDHVVRRVGTGDVTPLPDAWRGHLAGRSPHTHARIVAPALSDFRGRSLFLEADQLVLDDLTALVDFDLAGAPMAAVHRSDARGADWDGLSGDVFAPGVILFDNERCRGLEPVATAVRSASDPEFYEDAVVLGPRWREFTGLDVARLDPRYNDLERCRDDTVVLHFTHWARQPWRFAGHPESDRWMETFLDAVSHGDVTAAELDAGAESDLVSRRVRTVAKLPRRVAPLVDRALQWRHGAGGSTFSRTPGR